MTHRVIPQRELRNNVSDVLRETQAGATFTITVRGRPAARLLPPEQGPRTFVDRAELRRILAPPIDSAELAADLDAAEAALDDPWDED
jgi:prevent-host-death family protein